MTINGQIWQQGQPIPFAPANELETRAQYGARMVLHIMETSETALFSRADLELALAHATACYVGRWEGVGKDRQYVSVGSAVLARIREVRQVILMVLAARAAEITIAPVTVLDVKLDTPNEGPMARVVTKPIIRPPAGSLATIDF